MSSARDALSVLERRMLARVRARNLRAGSPESKACVASCPSLPMSMSTVPSQVANAGPPASTKRSSARRSTIDHHLCAGHFPHPATTTTWRPWPQSEGQERSVG
jgi:hypothetical protein